MPFTFSGSDAIGSLRDFGNDAAQMILQTGQQISQGLQQMMTNRQVSAMGAELGQLNPESPDWAKQAIALGGRFPLAMKSPAGQFMLSTQAKAHADWRQAQRAATQADAIMKRQVGLENLRTENDIKLEGIKAKNRMGAGVDLTGINLDAPQEAPLGAGAMSMGLPGVAAAANAASGEEPVPLFGMRGGLSDIARGAFSDLQEEQEMTGIRHTPAQINMRVLDAKRAKRQQDMQEDRQRASEEAANRRAAEAEKSRATSEGRMLKSLDASAIKRQITSTESDISAARRALTAFEKQTEKAKRDDYTSEEGKEYRRLQGVLEEAGNTRTRLTEELKGLTSPESEAEQFDTEAAARKAGKQSGDIIILLNPQTGQYQRAKLK